MSGPLHPDEDWGIVGDALLRTDSGLCHAKDLRPGMQLQTRDNGMTRIVGCLSCLPSRYGEPGGLSLNRVEFQPGTLNVSKPLVLGAGQPVLLQHWLARALFGHPEASIRAGYLVNQAEVRWVEQNHPLIQLTLESAAFVAVEGLLLWLPDPERSTPPYSLSPTDSEAAGECGLFVGPTRATPTRGTRWSYKSEDARQGAARDA